MTTATKSRGIIFRGDMVRAILAGAKSQTRRLVKDTGLYAIDARFHPAESVASERRALATQCPYGVPGDELWVRETFGVVQSIGADRDHDGERYVYRADPASDYQWSGAASQGFRWKPSIFMPREASRLTLVVKSVRVDRLSAITREDAIAEGFPGTFGTEELEGLTPADEYIVAFRALNKLAADADPWVWVIEFARKQGGAA